MQRSVSRLELTYHHPFRIARGGSTTTTSILVTLTHQGLTGRGEGVPVRYYGWTADRVVAAAEALGGLLADREPAQVSSLYPELLAVAGDQMPAVSAVDMALWDLHAQQLGSPLYRVLGLNPKQAGLTSFTIGLAPLDEMLAKVDEAAQYPILKVKCGQPGDLETLAAIRQRTDQRLWVDANAGWGAPEAIELTSRLADLGVELVEQPVAADDLDGLAEVTAASPIPVVADESCRVAADVLRLTGKVHGVNVKLDKAGGISGSLQLIQTARAAGLKVMCGCMAASSVALTAAAHLAPLVDWCDLDGHLLLADDPFCGMTAPAGKILLPESSGLGIRSRVTL